MGVGRRDQESLAMHHSRTLESMDRDTYKPSGCCPHCGHAIDPGICQECGLEVTAQTLRRRPLRKVAWGKAVVAVLVVTSMYIAYHQTDWIQYIPTNVLLWAQGDLNSRTVNELGRRFSRNMLTDAETSRFVDNAVWISPELVIRDPHPAGETIRIGLTFSIQLPGRYCRAQVVQGDSTLNNAAVRVSRGSIRGGTGEHTDEFRISAQRPGEYRLELGCTLLVYPTGGAWNSGWTREFVSSGDFTVVSGRLMEHVDAVIGDDAIEHVRNGIHFAAKGVQFGVWISEDVPTIAGRAYFRFAPEEDWSVMYVGQDDGVFSPGFNNVHRFSSSLAVIGDRVDFKIVGDANVAFDAGLPEYFAGVIEWLDVPVERTGNPVIWASDHRREDAHPPTRIYPVGESPDASAPPAD